jgi:hypothetical protein
MGLTAPVGYDCTSDGYYILPITLESTLDDIYRCETAVIHPAYDQDGGEQVWMNSNWEYWI